MEVSVVLCTYAESMYDDFTDAANSILTQSYDKVELVIVIDGSRPVCEAVQTDYGHRDNVVIHCNEENKGLSASRNVGIDVASGDVVAFLDDDAIADEEWIEELVDSYREQDATAVGGKMTPLWVDGKPGYLPEEFYWLIGVTHKGYPDEECEVRNTFGSNISFHREVLQELGGFDEQLGRKGTAQVQGEETELSVRMYKKYGERVWYTPDAEVGHKVFDYRTERWWLLKRAFWQGYSKRIMTDLVDEDSNQESDFLWELLIKFLPSRVSGLLRQPSLKKVDQLLMLMMFTFSVGLGFLFGVVRRQ